MGAGPSFVLVGDLVLDAAQNRLIALDTGIPALVTVDLSSGDRALLPLDAGRHRRSR